MILSRRWWHIVSVHQKKSAAIVTSSLSSSSFGIIGPTSVSSRPYNDSTRWCGEKHHTIFLGKPKQLQNRQIIGGNFSTLLTPYNNQTRKILLFWTDATASIKNRREFSKSAATTTTTTASTPPIAIEKTKKVHQIPVGSLTKDQWIDAVDNLLGEFWAAQSETEYVGESFSLLERLAKEYDVNQQLTSADKKVLNNNILQKVVLNWEKWRRLMPRADMLNPQDVLRLVDDWTGHIDGFKPDSSIYNAIMGSILVSSFSKGVHPKHSALMIQQIFDRIENPTSKSYEVLMKSHIEGGDIDSVLAVMDQLLHTPETATKGQQERKALRFRSTLFDDILAACVNAKLKRGGFLAEDILNRMHRLHKIGILARTPSAGYYNFVMHCWAKSGHPEAAGRAQNILEYMKQNGPKPNAISYSSAMDAWAQQGNAEQADKLVVEICNEFKQGNNDLKPDILHFNTVLDALANTHSREAGIRAEEHLQLMWRLYNTKFVDFTPNYYSYTCVVDAWAGSGHPETVLRAEKIFYEMLQKSKEDTNFAPTTTSMNTLANALVKSRKLERAERMIAQLYSEYGVVPDNGTFGIIIDGIAKKGGKNAGRQAEAILRRMEQSDQVGVDPDGVTYSSVIHAWAQSGNLQAGIEATRLLREMENKARGNPEVKPCVTSYSSAIDAWSKSGHRDAGVNAENLLREMEAMAKDDPDVKPNVLSYTSVINAWSKSGHRDAGFNAEKLLRQMQFKARDDPGMRPNVTSYTSVIDAWSKSGHKDAGTRAEKLLREMEDKARRDPNMRPNGFSYNSAINAWAAEGNFEAAEALLKEMVVGSKKDKRLQPDVFAFTNVIKALSRSVLPNKGEIADKYLVAMEALYHQNEQQNTKPNIATYRLVHKCWTMSSSSSSSPQQQNTTNTNPDAPKRIQEINSIIAELKRQEGNNRGQRRRLNRY